MSWDLRDSTAKWNESDWSVKVALANGSHQPSIQIHDAANRELIRIAIMPHEPHVTHSAIGIPFGDVYVRQKDLIAIFPESMPWRFGYQLDMRMLEDAPKGTLAIEIWLSIQTSLLDTHPQLELRWRGESFHSLMENCWINESSRAGLLVHPLDQQDCQVESDHDGLIMSVFGRFMEKGVIRRMRFRLFVTPKSELAEFWRDRFEEFSESPLPLTT